MKTKIRMAALVVGGVCTMGLIATNGAPPGVLAVCGALLVVVAGVYALVEFVWRRRWAGADAPEGRALLDAVLEACVPSLITTPLLIAYLLGYPEGRKHDGWAGFLVLLLVWLLLRVAWRGFRYAQTRQA
ncbi:MAG TPA: hypothetical protein PKN23_03485 [Candidatus Hydrogenedentes bacterium]|nr:hypothetical protein [Candidatus Hydrogenedentota bacterium]